MDAVLFATVAVIAAAMIFDYTNGFHDAANAIATSVSTRALRPKVAVAFAGVLNFAGAFISIEVATTVGKGIVDSNAVTVEVVLAGVLGAITWNLFTWLRGLPTSSSHALIGGVMGSAIAANGFDVVLVEGIVEKVLVPSLLSPVIGMLLAGTLTVAIVWAFRKSNPHRSQKLFRKLQIGSAGFVALTHGTNDAQKTMGVIALALVAADPNREFDVPFWVIFSAALAIALGTYAGGWRIIRTLGRRVTHLEPYQGFAAETATAAILYTTGTVGLPVSTTHTISGSVLGAGAVRSFNAVRWGIVRRILIAWVVTIPCAGAVAALMELVTRLPGGSGIVFALAVMIGAGAYWLSSRIHDRPSRAPSIAAAATASAGARP